MEQVGDNPIRGKDHKHLAGGMATSEFTTAQQCFLLIGSAKHYRAGVMVPSWPGDIEHRLMHVARHAFAAVGGCLNLDRRFGRSDSAAP